MAKGKQTKLSDKKKVIKAKLEDPESSLRDIEKKTWIPKSTVDTTLKEIPNIVGTSLDKWAKIMEAIDEIIENSTEIARRHLSVLRDKKDISTRDVKTVTEIQESYFKKKQLLEGKPTDILQEYLAPEQAKKIAQRYMNK